MKKFFLLSLASIALVSCGSHSQQITTPPVEYIHPTDLLEDISILLLEREDLLPPVPEMDGSEEEEL